jgi:hypothetical protein
MEMEGIMDMANSRVFFLLPLLFWISPIPQGSIPSPYFIAFFPSLSPLLLLTFGPFSLG